jgi:hypothetical protein
MIQGIFNCVVLLERLREAGYNGGNSILKEYVHSYRPAKALPAVRRYEHRPVNKRKWIGASAITRTVTEYSTKCRRYTLKPVIKNAANWCILVMSFVRKVGENGSGQPPKVYGINQPFPQNL